MRAARSRCPLGSPNRSGQPAGSFSHDRVGWEGQPSRDGTARIDNLGTVLCPGAAHLSAVTNGPNGADATSISFGRGDYNGMSVNATTPIPSFATRQFLL